MFFDFVPRFVRLSASKKPSRKAGKVNHRRLCFEPLESRELLDVSAAEFAAIRAQYADLNLSANMADYNVIEITADQLSAGNLQDAIWDAGETTKKDLIVLRTTAQQNKITYTYYFDYAYINIDATQYGSVTIVGFGDQMLTIDINQKSRAMYIEESSVALANIKFMNGSMGAWDGDGGAILADYSNLTITHCEFVNNTAAGIYWSAGGAIVTYDSNLLVTYSEFANNKATSAGGGQGGAICAYDGKVTIDACRFVENVCASPGAGFFADGGALYTDTCDVIIQNTLFLGNSATGDGWGGGYHQLKGTSKLTNVVFSGNQASSNGGGMFQRGGRATLTNVTIAGNFASRYGAGFYVDGLDGAGNGYTTLNNSIVAQNNGENYHTSQGGSSTINSSTTSGDPGFVRNPGAIGSKNYGDLSLKQGSSAINAGNNSYIPAGITTDITGKNRIINGTVDRGAYEYGTNPATKLGAPALGTVSATSSSAISVNWSTVANATGYTVQYATNAGFTTGVGTVSISSGSTLSTSITGLLASTTYYVRILAKGNVTNYTDSDYSASKTATTQVQVIKLGAPALGTVSATSPSAISVNWAAVTNASGYTVQYATNAGFTTGVGTVNVGSGSTTSTSITGLSASTMYYVRILAKGNGTTYSDSDYSTAKNVTTNPVVTLATPTLETVTAKGQTKLSVNWTAVSNASGYTVQYSVNSDFTAAKTVQVANGTTIGTQITGLQANTTYYVRILAKGDGVNYLNSSYSTSKNATTFAANVVMTPEHLRSTSTGQKAIQIEWNHVEGAIEYILQRQGPGDSDFVTVYDKADAKFMDVDCVAGTTYQYQVQAVTAGGTSSFTDAISVTTRAATVGDIPMVTDAEFAADNKSATVTWANLGSTYHYQIYRNGNLLTPTAIAANSWVDTTLGTSTQCRYIIVGYDYTDPVRTQSMPFVLTSNTIVPEIAGHDVSNGKITLNWDLSNFSNVQAVRVYRNGFLLLNTASATSVTDVNPALSPRGNYEYIVYVVANGVTTFSATYAIPQSGLTSGASSLSLLDSIWSDLDFIEELSLV